MTNKRIFIPILIVSFLTSFILLMSCLTGPQHNLIPLKEIVFSGFCFCILFLAIYLWVIRICPKHKHLNNILFWLFLALYTVMLFCIGLQSGDIISLFDYEKMRTTADDILNNRSIQNSDYYMVYSNNFKPTLVLAFIQRISFALGIKKTIFTETAFSVLLTISSILSVRYIAGKSKAQRELYQLPILALFIFNLPAICFVSFSYTDTYSYGIGIIGIALIMLGIRNKDSYRIGSRITLYVLAGFLFGFGVIEKITAIIPLIAIILISLLWKKFDRERIIATISAVIALTIFIVLTDVGANSFEVYREAQNTKAPLENWIAIGLYGDGTFATAEANGYYVYNPVSTIADKKAQAMQYIRENSDSLLSLNHYVAKLRATFATGNMGAIQIIYTTDDMDITAVKLFHPYGSLYWKASTICFAYMMALWISITLGAIAGTVALIKGNSVSINFVWSTLAVFGFILFMLIWEAAPRQVYNQVPVLILCTVTGLREIITQISRRLRSSGHYPDL